jgi:threonine synthase
MSSRPFYHLARVTDGKIFKETETTTSCPETGVALDIIYDYEYIRSRLNMYALRNAPINAQKYLDLYPLHNLDLLVTLNEGGTPLRHCKELGNKFGLKKLYVKNEGANPTGVFKDRGSLVELTKARELGAKAVCCASTGNMAASVAAYAAAAKMPCYVLVPEGTPIGKLSQSLIYGARIIQVRGTYADCCVLCEEMARKNNFYLAGDYVFRSEGQKSAAYEIVEQLFWQVPDVVIVPVGCGTNIAAIWKGFKELQLLGLVDKTPRMIAVQPSNVPTIVQAFHEEKAQAVIVEKPSTVASAVGIGVPLDDHKALDALYSSNGYAESASETEILEAEKDMGHLESLFVEPSSAIPVAVLPKLRDKGIINENSVVVCIATGIGLKDPKSATIIMPAPPVLEPTFDHINTYIENKVYNIRAVAFTGKETHVWEGTPNPAEVAKVVETELNIELSEQNLTRVYKKIQDFHEKTDRMRKSDLQYIVENVLKDPVFDKKILELLDFNINLDMHKKAIGKVKLNFHGKEIEAEGTGAGPVDALINATKKGISATDTIDCVLTTYDVEIKTSGTDAVVEVHMGVKDKFGNKTITSATSPDIIVASITAFEKGYNILFYKGQ